MQGKRPPGWVGTQMAHRAAQGLGAGQLLSGLDPSDVNLGLCLHTWQCQISLVSRSQDGGAPLIIGWQEAEV